MDGKCQKTQSSEFTYASNDALLAARKGVIRLAALLTEVWVILGVGVLLVTILEVSLTSYYERADKKAVSYTHLTLPTN
ncbi:hypothetical protein, partial [Bradyrhizobium sp. UFLA06-06]